MKILAFTGNRADFYLQLPLYRRLNADKEFNLKLLVSGGILTDSDSTVLADIKNNNLIIGRKIILEKLPKNHSYAISEVIFQTSKYIEELRPDLCIVYADRFESFGFSVASFHADIPCLHLEAGDITNGGTYDDNIRHCITKMSHLFCTSTRKGLDILNNLGEESWRSIHSGLISYEDMKNITEKDKKKIIDELELENKPIILCTMHPIPNLIKETIYETSQLFHALKKLSYENNLKIIITAPNNDSGSKDIRDFIDKNINLIKGAQFIDTLGGHRYQSLLSLARNRSVIVCGNSSSIIKEAPYFSAHGLNIGKRQLNRECANSQINCIGNTEEIYEILSRLINEKCEVNYNPYYVENSSMLIQNFIKKIFLTKSKEEILNKKWHG